MPPERIARRRFVQTSVAATGILGVTLAGCTDTVGELGGGNSPGPDEDRPGWSPYVATGDVFADDGEEAAFYTFVDFDAMAEFEEFGGFEQFDEFDPESDVGSGRAGDVAFFAFPTLGLVLYVFSMFALIRYPFGDALFPDFEGDGSDGTDSDLETNVGLFSQFGLTFVGDYDVDALSAAAEGFAAVDSRDGFTVFEGGADSETQTGFSLSDGAVFAASSDVVLIPLSDEGGDSFGAEPDVEAKRDRIDAMIDVLSGERENAADANADVDWMLRSSGNGAFGFGAFGERSDSLSPKEKTENVSGDKSGPQDDFLDEETTQALEDIEALLEDATGYTSSVDLESESAFVVSASVSYDDSDAVPSEDAFEEVYGDTEGEYAIERGETRVYLSSTYST